MGSADCLIAGMAILLNHKMGSGGVVLVTGDNRLADVIEKCRSLSRQQADLLKLPDLAKGAGLEWSSSLYPPCIHLGRANDEKLREAFLGWPLPSRQIETKAPNELTPTQQRKLWKLQETIKAEYGTGPDSLPYSAALDDLQTRFGVQTGVYMTKSDTAKTLLKWRKNPKSRPV